MAHQDNNNENKSNVNQSKKDRDLYFRLYANEQYADET